MRIKIKHNRLRPKPNMKNKKNITKEDKEYLSYLQTLENNCFACGQRNKIEWHHVKQYSTDKKNHNRLIPLCGEECHRNGQTLSAHGTPKKFRESFPIEKQESYADRIYTKYRQMLKELT